MNTRLTTATENYVKLGLEHNPNMRFIVQLSWGGGDIDNQDFPNPLDELMLFLRGGFAVISSENSVISAKTA